jgi:hypothetical protein
VHGSASDTVKLYLVLSDRTHLAVEFFFFKLFPRATPLSCSPRRLEERRAERGDGEEN